MFRMLSNHHYPHRANRKLRSLANAVFQNRGVCGQAVPSFPSPSPVINFFCSCPSFLDEPREETLATQARLLIVRSDPGVGTFDFDRQKLGINSEAVAKSVPRGFLKVTLLEKGVKFSVVLIAI